MEFWYFGYGSNMNRCSLAAKGVKPLSSLRASLQEWRLRFNVTHFFTHEGGVGNIEPTNEATDVVWGVLHRCHQDQLSLLDAAEAYGHGYDRTSIKVRTDVGAFEAITYIGINSFLNNNCLPSRRYLKILLDGAIEAELPQTYIDALRATQVLETLPVKEFTPPKGNHKSFSRDTLSQQKNFTALAGHVFDMSNARWQHEFLKTFFGGKDMTEFHLRRMHGYDGKEFFKEWNEGRMTQEQSQYINEYLHAYQKEYRYCGIMEPLPPEDIMVMTPHQA